MIVGDIKFLKYEKRCFSLKHNDINSDYTCLIFPSNSKLTSGSKFTGGELIIYKYGKELVNFKPYELIYDTIVILPIELEHEVLPVICGERYVFKMSLANIEKPEIKYYSRNVHNDGRKDWIV